MIPVDQGEAGYPSTPSGRDKPGSIVVLPLYVQLPSYFPGAGRYVLGPAEMSGSVIAGAKAEFASPIDQWAVDITFTKAGSAQFNAVAAKHYRCYAQDPTNPPFCALQAVELDGTVLAAPALEASAFPGGATIAGSMAYPYTKAQAVKLASLVRTSSSMAPLHN
jgi:preprotein translocase subunit SecD